VIERLVFVYDADGTLAGEVRYWVGTLFGAEHCSLCDITHTRWGRRREFAACESRIGTPIEYFHRDDVPAELASIAAPPCVIGVFADLSPRVLLDRDSLAAIGGDVGEFERRLRAGIDAADGIVGRPD
jgi:hypothetical protein